MLGAPKVYEGTIDCCRKIYAKEGTKGFFRGLEGKRGGWGGAGKGREGKGRAGGGGGGSGGWTAIICIRFVMAHAPPAAKRRCPRANYAGLGVNCMRAVPGAAIQFFAYDTIKKLLGV